jgi:hypothetical protein
MTLLVALAAALMGADGRYRLIGDCGTQRRRKAALCVLPANR